MKSWRTMVSAYLLKHGWRKAGIVWCFIVMPITSYRLVRIGILLQK